jgi:translation initiation factor 1
MKNKKKIDVSESKEALGFNAFEGLELDIPLPAGPPQPPKQTASRQPDTKPKKGSGLRLEVKREKAGRGGKTVTVIYGVQTIDTRSKDALLKDLKRKFATGGSNMGKHLELQGDFADLTVELLNSQGYRAVRAGG